MTVYTIVDKDTDPLGPNEIQAGSTIQVEDGDSFVIASSANDNITFQAAGGGPADFDISFEGSNANGFDIKVEGDLSPSITVPDNANLEHIKLDAKAADNVNFTAGNNVSFGEYHGSDSGADVITIGDDFATAKNWNTGGGDDDVTFGDRATLENLDTKDGNDNIRFGDDLSAHDIMTGDGDDTIYLGANADVNKIDGGSGNDTLNTQTTGGTTENVETTNVVCFARGTMLETQTGGIAVENLRAGHMVRTMDHGVQPVRWVGAMRVDGATLAAQARLRPIRIRAGALAAGIPSADLVVSSQHRVLLRSRIVTRMFAQDEIFVPANLLTILPGVTRDCPAQGVAYYHVLFDHHEVLIANRVESESLYLGAQAVAALGERSRAEIAALNLAPDAARALEPMARLAPNDRPKLRQLLKRHVKNGQPPVSAPAIRRLKLAG